MEFVELVLVLLATGGVSFTCCMLRWLVIKVRGMVHIPVHVTLPPQTGRKEGDIGMNSRIRPLAKKNAEKKTGSVQLPQHTTATRAQPQDQTIKKGDW